MYIWLDCVCVCVTVQATFWEMSGEELSVKQRVRQQDSVLGVEKWEEHLVVSSTFVTLNSLQDIAQRRIVADDSIEDESLTVSRMSSMCAAVSFILLC